jgi:ankyrin repeat protein
MALQRLADIERLLREQPALATRKDAVPPLCRAAKYTELAYLRLLLAAGADVDAADPEGYTPLHWSSFWGDLPAVELLLQHRAKVSPAAANGLTPLHESVRLGHPDITARLLAAGAERTRKCQEGRLPLDYAEPGPHQQRFRTLLGGQH